MIGSSLRTLLKNPGFTSIAALILALGIASTAAIFSIVNSIVLEPLPFQESDRLVKIWEIKKTDPADTARNSVSFPNFVDWVERSKAFESLAAVQTGVSYHLTGGEEPYRVEAARVSQQFFSLLGREPIEGRNLLPEEDQQGGEPVVIVSHSLWRDRFGGDPALVGKLITLSGRPRRVVGIMPENFGFPAPDVDVWVPLAMDPAGNRWARFLDVYARLAPGVTLEQAQQDLSALAAQMEQENPGPNTEMGILVLPLKQEIVGDTERPLWLLLGAVAFVLLIACVNVTNLFLVRAISRQRDVAVCQAFGASRLRIVRQFLMEGIVLALLGGALGLLLAYWAVESLVALSPVDVPRLDEVSLGGEVVLLIVGLSLIIGIILGLAPSVAAWVPDLSRTLREGSRGTEGAGRRRVRTALVVCEIALAVVLMIGASLMMASFVRLFRVDPGFRTEDIVTLQFDLPRSSYPEGEQKAAFYDRMLERLKAIPGVSGVGMINHLPLSGSDTTWTFFAEGQPPAEPGSEPEGGYRVVDSDYFKTMSIPLLRGRGFDSRDHRKGAATVIVNREMAERFWPSTDPLGKRFRLGDASAEQPWLTIVGMVDNVKHTGLAEHTEPEMFLPYSPEWYDPMTVVVRAQGDPLAVIAPVRHAVRELDPNLPLYNVKPLAQVLSDSLARPRLNLVLMSAFAILALVLATVGIYGVMAQAVVQQKQRIAIQMALGATQRNVLGLVLRQGMTLTLTGLVIGLVAAAGFSRLLSGLLFEVGTTNPATFIQVAVLFSLVSLMAIYVPAFRAARVDPIACLKS